MRIQTRPEGEMDEAHLVQEFFRAPSENNCSIEGSGVLERWFSKPSVGWVLHLAGYASTWELGHPTEDCIFVEGTTEDYMWSWIPAFTEIMETHGNSGILQEGEFPPESGKQATINQHPLQFALFIQEAM